MLSSWLSSSLSAPAVTCHDKTYRVIEPCVTALKSGLKSPLQHALGSHLACKTSPQKNSSERLSEERVRRICEV